VRDVEVASKGFLLLAADQADEVVIVDRAAHRDGGLRFDRLGRLSTEGTERAGDRLAIYNENPADATLADLSITLRGTRT
jgi:hypothetical protein